RKLKFSFSAKAFTEVFTYSFCSAKENQFEDKDAQGLALQNPMPEEFQELKLSPYPSLIKSIISNQDRFEQIRVFEYARTYHRQKDELAAEKRWFCFAQLKNYKKNTPLESFTQDFLNLRDDVLQILLELNLPEISLERTQISYLHPNASLVAKWEGKTLFELGYLHPAQQDSLGLNQRLLLGKIDFSILLELYQKHIQSNRFHAPSVFPEDKIDISLVLDEKEPSEAYANIISQAQIPEAQKVWVHDIYSGENLPEGKKSVTYRVQLVTYDKTFSGKRIQEITQTLVHLAKDNNLQMRE
ncbi:MAG: phenylalanine--tRNA ligase subunit beta, partial [Spirochaetota bacterium]